MKTSSKRILMEHGLQNRKQKKIIILGRKFVRHLVISLSFICINLFCIQSGFIVLGQYLGTYMSVQYTEYVYVFHERYLKKIILNNIFYTIDGKIVRYMTGLIPNSFDIIIKHSNPYLHLRGQFLI